MNILSDLAENAESESVRLVATRDLLDRAGFRPVDRHEIVKERSIVVPCCTIFSGSVVFAMTLL